MQMMQVQGKCNMAAASFFFAKWPQPQPATQMHIQMHKNPTKTGKIIAAAAARVGKGKGNSDMAHVLALDIGTSGTKGALISSTGRIVSSAYAPHPSPSPSPLWRGSMEQDQDEWWVSTKIAIKACLSNIPCMERCCLPVAISLTGQMQDIIFLPKEETGQKRNAILYSDARAFLEAKEIDEMVNDVVSLSSIRVKENGTSLLAKLRWLDKHDRNVAAESKGILFGGHDYVAWKLTGAVVTDATTASTTGLTDQTFQYAESLLKKVNLGHWINLLPPVISIDMPCGEVSKVAAEEIGILLLEGIPVLHCCGDAGACSFGAGAGSPGHLYGYLGTTGWIGGSFLQSDKSIMRNVPGVFTLAHPDSDIVFRTGSIMTAGGNLSWAMSNFVYNAKMSVSFEEVDTAASLAETGSRGLLYLPFLCGERCPFDDPFARAAFIGISQSTSQKELFRAVMEGVAFAMRSARDALSEHLVADNLPLRLVGGGARSKLWPRIIANVLGQPVEVLEESQDVAVKGAAFLAGRYLGWHNGFNDHWLKVVQRCHPSKEEIGRYDYMYSIYKDAYSSLKAIFGKLSSNQM